MDDKKFGAAYRKAYLAGYEAGKNAIPTPMVVADADIFGNPMPGGRQYFVSEGVCGFAWVNVKPGNAAFARWLKTTGRANRDSYNGGVTVWIGEFNQSHTRKAAMAQKMAEVLKAELADANLRIYANDRLD